MKNLKLSIEGMDYKSCATTIENMLKMRGLVSKAKEDYKSKKATIDFDEKKTDKQKIVKAIIEVGYHVEGVD